MSIIKGNWILENKILPSKYIWSYASKDIYWLDDQWCFNVIISYLFQTLSWPGLAIFKALLCISFVLFFSLAISNIVQNIFVASVITTIVSLGTLEKITLTPLLLVFAIVALQIFLLSFYFEKSKNYIILLLIFLSGIILANSYYGYPFLALGIVLLFSHYFSARKEFFLILFLLLLPTILSPYAFNALPWTFYKAQKYLLYFLNTQTLAANIFDYPLACQILLSSLVFITLFSLGNIVKYKNIFYLFIFLTILALVFKTLMPLALIVSALLLAFIFSRCREESKLGPIFQGLLILQEKLSKLSYTGSIFLLFCIAYVNIENLRRVPIVTALLPEVEVSYVLDKKLSFPLWHQSIIAPYLAYRFSVDSTEPKNLIAWDHEVILNKPRLLIEESHKMWRRGFEEISPKTVLVHYYTALFDALSNDPQWKLVYLNAKEVLPEEDWKSQKGLPFHAWAIFVRL